MKGKEQGMACIDFNWVWLNRAQVGGLNHITIVVWGGGGQNDHQAQLENRVLERRGKWRSEALNKTFKMISVIFPLAQASLRSTAEVLSSHVKRHKNLFL